MNFKSIAYWAATVLLAFAMISGGVGELGRQWGTLDTVRVLGFPEYLLTILGFWKVLGGIVILAPRVPRLKEWAYAGIFFNMTGAAASHAFASDYGVYAYHIVATLFLAGLAVASWALLPPGRALALQTRDAAWGTAFGRAGPQTGSGATALPVATES